MKRILLGALCCLTITAALWAEKPRRIFEWGVDAGAGIANSAFALTDIFNSNRTLKIDLDDFGKQSFDIATSASAQTFFTLNLMKEVKGETKKVKGEKVDGKREVSEILGEKDDIWSFQLYTGVDSLFFGSLSQEITEFFADGNVRNQHFHGTGGLGISVIADVGLRGSRKFGRWTVGVDPAVFVPIIYAANPDVRVTVNTTGTGLNGGLFVDADLYTAVPLDTMYKSDDITGSSASSAGIPLGFDLSGSVEYELFSFLDIGGSIAHLPIVPAVMDNHARAHMEYSFDVDNLINQLEHDGFNLDNVLESSTSYTLDNEKKQVFRPLRFDVYGRFKAVPLKWLKLSARPSFGLSFLTVYGDKPCFNLGLEGRLDLLRLLSLRFGTSLRENMWQQKAVLELNLRAIELDFGIASQSQDFVGSILGRGLGASFGLRLGW